MGQATEFRPDRDRTDARKVAPLPRPDWRDSLSLAADLVLVGLLMVLGCLTIVGAGAALTTASVAVNRAVLYRSFPSFSDLRATARASFLRGLAATLVVLAVGTLIALDVLALQAGRVPGGIPLLVGVGAIAAAGIAVAAVGLVRLGQTEGCGFRAALRYAVRLLGQQPLVGIGILATLAVAALLCWLMPVLVAFLPGVTLFALHVVVRRATG